MLMKCGKKKKTDQIEKDVVVNVFNLVKNSSIYRYSGLIKKAVKSVIKLKNVEVNLIFVDGNYIKEINKKYLNSDKLTDVISFNYKFRKKIPGEVMPFGDIYICVDVAKEQAKAFNLSFITEILILSVHGALHLLGFEDYKLSDRINMSIQTIEALRKITENI